MNLGYKEQNCIIHFFIMQLTSRGLLTVAALPDGYEAMVLSRPLLICLCWENNLILFTWFQHVDLLYVCHNPVHQCIQANIGQHVDNLLEGKQIIHQFRPVDVFVSYACRQPTYLPFAGQ